MDKRVFLESIKYKGLSIKEQVELYYEQYWSTYSDESLGNFLDILGKYASRKVKFLLLDKHLYSIENFEDVIQEGTAKVLIVLRKDRECNVRRDEPISYYYGVFYNSVYDWVRKDVRDKVRLPRLSIDSEANDDCDDSALERRIDKEHSIKAAEDIYIQMESKDIHWSVFQKYCQYLVNDYKLPQRNLALFYSSVLYHMSESGDVRKYSPSWAIERMGENTVSKLKEESERILVERVDSNCCWCKEYVDKLQLPCQEIGTQKPFSEIIYTKAFSKSRIEDMTENMQKVLHRALNKEFNNNITDSDKMVAYFEGSALLLKLFER